MPENQIRNWMELQEKYSFTIIQTMVKGGRTRFHSVKNGLEFIDSPGLVAIHDGVRPFVSTETIKRCFDAAESLAMRYLLFLLLMLSGSSPMKAMYSC